MVFVLFMLVSIAVGLAASGLGSFGHALVQWAGNAVIAPITALSASVLYFELLGTGAGAAPAATPETPAKL